MGATPPPPGTLTSPDGRALFVDYAGVLTPGLAEGWRRFEREHDMPERTIVGLLWGAYDDGQDDNPVARVERGELDGAAFEREIAETLAEAGHPVEADGLLERLFADLHPAGGVWSLVDEVRAAGVPAALVSNSWGSSGYPMERLEATFDAIVISGSVGLRKPDRDIFVLAASRVDADLERCVLIDDGPPNLEAARSYGVTGVLHRGDDEETAAAVRAALGIG